MSQRTNEEWLADLREDSPGRDKALIDLRARLVQGLTYALRDYLSPASPRYRDLVEESVQEALLKVLDNLETFRGNSRFTTWAHKITIHVALTELRRKRWQDTSLEALLETDDGVMTPRFMADSASGPERTAVQADLIRRVQRIIAEELTEKQKTAIVATRIQGMPMSQVAEKMGVKQNALYKLLHDARLRLKKQLAAEGLSVEEVLAAFSD